MGTVRSTVLVLVGLTGGTLSSDAFAEVKVYHGAFCQGEGNDMEFSAVGAACADGPCLVKCPLMRDNINDDNNISVAYVEFFNSPAPAGATNNISCSFCTQVEDDESSEIFDCQALSTPATTGLVQLTFDEISTFDGDESSYFLGCVFATGDILVQIHIDEQN